MTGRVCPVHGEYSPTGVCRWCEPGGADQSTITLPLMCICNTCLRSFEAPIPLTSLQCPECRAKPQTLLDVALSAPKVRPLPVTEPRCRCGEYAWEPPCPPDMREGVIDGVFHSEAQCFKLGAEPPGTERVLVEFVDDGPFRPPMIVEWRIRTEPERTEAVIDAETHAAEQSRLASEHAALRWERVARRWNYKHRRPGGLDCGGREWVWMHWLDQMERRYAYLTWTPRQPP